MFYCYAGNKDLGQEPLGSDGRLIWKDLKTERGAKTRAKRLFGSGNYRLYRFSNFHDDKTFREVR